MYEDDLPPGAVSPVTEDLPPGAVSAYEGTSGDPAKREAELNSVSKLFGLPTTEGQRYYRAMRPWLATGLETAGAVAGGVVGAPTGPWGAAGGAGLGYGMAKQGLNWMDEQLGGYAPTQTTITGRLGEAVTDVATGATFEMGGRLATKGLGVLAKGAGLVSGEIKALAAGDVSPRAKLRAAEILREAAQSSKIANLDDFIWALKVQGKHQPAGYLTTAQATADMNAPTWQALLDRAGARDPGFLAEVEKAQTNQSLKNLYQIAPGATETQGIQGIAAMEDALAQQTNPARSAALRRANHGRNVQFLERRAVELDEAAKARVEEFRRQLGLARNAESRARVQLVQNSQPRPWEPNPLVRNSDGMSVPAAAEMAENAVARGEAAAADSLTLGNLRRASEQAAATFRARGIQPLEANQVIANIQNLTDHQLHPELAGGLEARNFANKIIEEIRSYTDKGGIIDAEALHAIRKNVVNDYLGRVQGDPQAARKTAERVMMQVKPVIDDAIESAGGKGWKQYLADYSAGMHKIKEKELTGEALRLWKTNKEAFVRLVNGEEPDVVRKIFGERNFDIAKELTSGDLGVLTSEAAKVTRYKAVKDQAQAGQQALTQLLEKRMSGFRLPGLVDEKISIANRVLDYIRKGSQEEAYKLLTSASQSPSDAVALLQYLPLEQRSKILRTIASPSRPAAQAVGVTGKNIMDYLLSGSEEPVKK